MSFLYDVESSSGNTGRGLIVVKVVRESVPDYPVVADTVLTAETREDFPRGVDVLAGKATWSGGDVSDLEVVAVGRPRRRHGRRRRAARRAPRDDAHHPVRRHRRGRRRARSPRTRSCASPATTTSRWRCSAGAAPPEVTELESVSFDMADLVAKPRGSRARGRAADVRASGARARGGVRASSRARSCATTPAPGRRGSMRARCRCGSRGRTTGPTCPCRSWCSALDPQPELRAGSMTVGPGETATLRPAQHDDLAAARGLGAASATPLDYAGSAFDVSLDGSIVTVTGADRAVPGSEEAAIVSVTSHAGVAPVRLILRVGAAPSTLPQGGSLTQQCSQAAGSSCTITVDRRVGRGQPAAAAPRSRSSTCARRARASG